MILLTPADVNPAETRTTPPDTTSTSESCPSRGVDVVARPSAPAPPCESVREVQRLLTDWGYPVEIDGRFGPGTEAAVVQFQLDNSLVADGIVGPKTWDRLHEPVGDFKNVGPDRDRTMVESGLLEDRRWDAELALRSPRDSVTCCEASVETADQSLSAD